MDMTPSVICTSEQQNEAINFEPHRVSDRQGIFGCFHKLKSQDFSGDHAEAVFFREIFDLDDGWVHGGGVRRWKFGDSMAYGRGLMAEDGRWKASDQRVEEENWLRRGKKRREKIMASNL
jgi:hypothetical protein